MTTHVSGPHGAWLGSAGVANVTSGEPMRPDAPMRLDSASKWWATAVVLQLAQEGKLRLGDTVQRRLPYGKWIFQALGLKQTSYDPHGPIADRQVGTRAT